MAFNLSNGDVLPLTLNSRQWPRVNYQEFEGYDRRGNIIHGNRTMMSEKIYHWCYLPWPDINDTSSSDLSTQCNAVKKYPELILVGYFLAITLVIAHCIKANLILPNSQCASFINLHYIIPLLLMVIWKIIVIIKHSNKITNDNRAYIYDIYIDQFVRLFSFIVIIWLHFNIKIWIPLINNLTYDQIYYNIDIFCLPLINNITALRQVLANYLPFVDMIYFYAFIMMFFISFSVHSILHPEKFRRVFLATLLVQALGALSYLIMPAVGPFIYDHSLNNIASQAQSVMWECRNSVKMFGPEWLAAHGAEILPAGLAAMPSLHIAASWVFVYYAFKYARYLLPLYLPLFLWILIEAVSAKWHYLIDLPAGLLLSSICIWLSNKVYGDL